MANPHFGKLGDVWKHAALAEVLERERPRRYAETHAGSVPAAVKGGHWHTARFGVRCGA
jgi:23S rRNA A2030 N6-methylase RlmJ